MKRKLILAGLILSFLSLAAGLPQAPHEVYGTVTQDGSAIEGAEVRFESSGSSFNTTTDSEGSYQLRIPHASGREGTLFDIILDGEDLEDDLVFRSGDITEKNIALTSEQPEESQGGAGGGGAGGAGGGGGGLPQPEEQNDTAENIELQVEPEELEFRLRNGENETREIQVRNQGNVDLQVEAVSRSLEEVTELDTDFSISAGESETVEVGFTGSEPGFYGGSIELTYEDNQTSIPVRVDVFEPEPEITTNVSTDNNTIRYSVDVDGAGENDRVSTEIYNSDGELVYTRNHTTNASSTKIQGEIDSNLDPGEYTFESRIIGSETASASTNFRVVELRNDFNILMILIPSLLLLIAVWKFRKEKQKKDNFRKKLEKQMTETEKHTANVESSSATGETGISMGEQGEDSEQELEEVDKFLEGEVEFESVGEPEQAKDISQQIKSGIEDNHDPEKAKELQESLEKSKDILADLALREKVPEIVGEKEKQVMEELGNQNYGKANLILDQIREILDRSEEMEETGKKEEAEETGETEKSEDKQEKQGSEEPGEDYSDLVHETVKDAKKKIRTMEDPDYEEILEEEKKNKDRKTLKKFLNRKIEG